MCSSLEKIIHITQTLSYSYVFCDHLVKCIPPCFVQSMVLGVDLVDEETADNILGPEKDKGDKSSGGGVADFKTNDDEMLPAWQTEGIVQPASFDNPTK